MTGQWHQVKLIRFPFTSTAIAWFKSSADRCVTEMDAILICKAICMIILITTITGIIIYASYHTILAVNAWLLGTLGLNRITAWYFEDCSPPACQSDITGIKADWNLQLFLIVLVWSEGDSRSHPFTPCSTLSSSVNLQRWSWAIFGFEWLHR